MKNLIGIPYEKADCWELTKIFYREKMGADLKHYFEGPTPDRDSASKLIYSNKGDFQEVTGERLFGDILTMTVWGIECHVAVYIGEGKILHTMKGTGSIIDRLERWSRMVTGTYRLPQESK